MSWLDRRNLPTKVTAIASSLAPRSSGTRSCSSGRNSAMSACATCKLVNPASNIVRWRALKYFIRAHARSQSLLVSPGSTCLARDMPLTNSARSCVSSDGNSSSARSPKAFHSTGPASAGSRAAMLAARPSAAAPILRGGGRRSSRLGCSRRPARVGQRGAEASLFGRMPSFCATSPRLGLPLLRSRWTGAVSLRPLKTQ
mmetsp:Transcript_79303/g.256769  ORF Transcript_79303/g.256769 Transcript_79303/m.256769 type:complete len:200 (+) Transcript_79303:1204-1803(+)